MRQRKRTRVLGPYRRRGQYQLHIVEAQGTRSVETFATEQEAQDVKAAIEDELAGASSTLDDALKDYADYMRIDRGNKPSSIETTLFRLRSLFTLDDVVGDLTPKHCAELYRTLSERVSVDTHRNTLGQAKTFCEYCIDKGWLASNPFKRVKAVGRRKAGKEQLTIDETRQWLRVVHDAAESGDEGALANLVLLYLGMRPLEVVTRTVRDLDDDARILWIRSGKTRHAARRMRVPDVLRDLLVRHIRGKANDALIFGHNRDWLNRNTGRLCRLAGVPRITAHSLRGLHTTLAAEAGATANLIAAQVGHGSIEVTKRHYMVSGTTERANQRRLLDTVLGDSDAE